MKLTIDIDCSPDEARRFLGLPDVHEMQQSMIKEIQKKFTDNLASMDPEQMMKTWLPTGTEAFSSLEGFQKMFWSQAMSPAEPDKETTDGSE